MTAQHYEAIAEVPKNYCLQLQRPLEIPARMVRVAIIFEPTSNHQATGDSIKKLFAAMPNVGEDAGFVRPHDIGREELT